MRLETKNIILRPFEPEWAPTLYRWYYSGDYEEYYRHCGEAYKLQDFVGYINSPGQRIFAIWDKAADRLVGVCGLHDIAAQARNAKMMLMIEKESQHKGYLRETMGLLARYCFEYANYHKIGFQILASNERLNRLAKECGFKQEGTLKENCWYQNQWVDETWCYLLAEDYNKLYAGKEF